MIKKSNAGRKRERPVLNGPLNDLIFERMVREQVKSLNDWADKHQIGRTTLRDLVMGRQSPLGTWVRPELPTQMRLAKALGVPLSFIIERLYSDELDIQILPSAPVVGWVGAGPGQQAELNERIPLDHSYIGRGTFIGYRVRGNSMCSGPMPICNDDRILVNKDDKGHSGTVVVARLKDNAYVCKLLKEDRTGKFLVSRNPDVENGSPAIIPSSQVAEIMGRVVEVRKPADLGSGA